MSRRSIAIWVMCLAMVSLVPAVRGQTAAEPAAPPSAAPPQTMSPPIQLLLTGCLKRANDGGYRLTDANGVTWLLSSKSVDLAAQLNHSVTVTGKPTVVAKEQAKDQANDGSSVRSLQVLTVKMLSNSCTR